MWLNLPLCFFLDLSVAFSFADFLSSIGALDASIGVHSAQYIGGNRKSRQSAGQNERWRPQSGRRRMSRQGAQRIVASSSAVEDGAAKVKVLVRIRPFLGTEVGHDKCVLSLDEENEGNLLLQDPRRPEGALQYAFDHCYAAQASQEDIFKQEIEGSLSQLFKGVNTTIFCTGMTGAGKTHTMQGTREDPGIIPRTVRSVLEQAMARPKIKASTTHSNIVKATERKAEVKSAPTEELEAACSVYMSYFEIYNEKVYDLLEPKEGVDCPVREDASRKILIANLKESRLTSYADFAQLYELGLRNRKTAATKLNHVSSRSHALLLLKVKTNESPSFSPSSSAISSVSKISSSSSNRNASQFTFEAKLHLIDLAGNEDNRKTDNRGARMTESVNINSSLLALAKVVQALNDGEKRIPYRESKLTRLLQDSLGGHSIGIMIANVAPGLTHFLNTYNTLNFATKSRQVVNSLHAHSAVTYQEEDPAPVESLSPSNIIDSTSDRRRALEAWREQKNRTGNSSSNFARPSSSTNGSLASINSPSDVSSPYSTTTHELRSELAKLQKEHQTYKEQKQAQAKINESYLLRIAQLEKALLEKQSQNTENKIPSVLPTPVPGNATPCTKTKLIHSKIATAKNMEIIDPTEALRLYSEILSSLKSCGSDYKEVSIKVQARIDKMLAQCMDAQDKNSAGSQESTVMGRANLITTRGPPSTATGGSAHPSLTSRASQPALLARKPLSQANPAVQKTITSSNPSSARPTGITSAASQKQMVARTLFAPGNGKENGVPNVSAARKEISKNSDISSKFSKPSEISSANMKKRKPSVDQDQDFIVDSESESDEEMSETPVKRPAKKRKLASPQEEDKVKEEASARVLIAQELELLDEPAQQEVENILAVLNSGDVKKIKALHGIGKVRAEQIAERSQTISFTSLEQLIHAGLGAKLIVTLVRRNIVEAAYFKKMTTQPGASASKPLIIAE